MANRHGDFIWYELMTSDVDAAADFYGAVVGWRVRAFDEAAGGYRLFGTGTADVAGLMAIPADASAVGMRSCWLGYIGVDDVDRVAAAIVADGGAQPMPPTDIPGVGRIAMLKDPQGAPFYVMRASMEGESMSFAPTKPGHCAWNELATSDQAAALAFYARHFSWQKGDAMPMGDMGDYQLILQYGEMIGAMMTRMPGGPPPMWGFYFRVEDIDVAAERVAEHGGQILHGPVEVPGGDFIIIGTDPQGAMFGFVGARR